MDLKIHLFQAITNCDTRRIRCLLRNTGSDVNVRDEDHGQQTPLMRLCHMHIHQTELVELLSLLMDQCPDVNLQDDLGRTALSHACIGGRTTVIKELSCVVECDPNLPDGDGNTPLFYAVRTKNCRLVSCLIQCFNNKKVIDIDHINKKGVHAIEEAEAGCDSAMCRLLMTEGHADIGCLNNIRFPRDGRILLHPRSPTPDTLKYTPNSKHLPQRHKVNKVSLQGERVANHMNSQSPLVVTSLGRQTTSDLSQKHNLPVDKHDNKINNENGLLTKVEEEQLDSLTTQLNGNNINVQQVMPNSPFSLPDLKSTSSIILNTPPSSASSPSGLDMLSRSYPSYVNIDSQNLDTKTPRSRMRDNILPEVCEEGKERNGGTSYPTPGSRGRRDSLSLPDLRTCGHGLIQPPPEPADVNQRFSHSGRTMGKLQGSCVRNKPHPDDQAKHKPPRKSRTSEQSENCAVMNQDGEGDKDSAGVVLPELTTSNTSGIHRKGFSNQQSNAILRAKNLTLIANFTANENSSCSAALNNTENITPRLRLKGESLKHSSVGNN